ncbi:hypothetical protein [Vibrio pectenicida]|uniref:2OG-Fe(II) oxygenase n=1 Tax=Vibrio pectenicida TaxID=62763 RepID=A0A427U4Q7_9VIBR|nr:hypothetical protein [Vibrio pectenicida]RSD30697.1 hypothetical protein EJA03_12665 [Vibrio pectenicida]RSD31610.1 hypothetical protein EJA03_07995 [Vibrio pectenicida]
MKDLNIWRVPKALRQDESVVVHHGSYVSLETLFPGKGIGFAWKNDHLRLKLRHALKCFFLNVNAIKKLNISDQFSFMVYKDELNNETLNSITKIFYSSGVNISGKEFLYKIWSLCGNNVTGSVMEITQPNRRLTHSWHQDSGKVSNIVLLGFPLEGNYIGEGVFSHQVMLSHRIKQRHSDKKPSSAIVMEEFGEWYIPIKNIYKPIYSAGSELWVSDDSTHFHSVPDVQNRQCIWRFM